MNNFRNKPIDRRRLTMKDRSDLSRGGAYLQESNAYKRAKALNAQNKMIANRDQKTTVHTPGSGGQSPGIGIQQERYRQIGRQDDAAKSMRPDMDNSMYDIYSGS